MFSVDFRQPRLVYVYIGDYLPDYATPSLKLTRRFFRGEMIVLTDAVNVPHVNGVTFENFSDWYQEEMFSAFSAESELDAVFRGGFWLATAERFFVLSQYMKKEELDSFFHAELDNIVFNLDGLAEDLNRIGKGIFYPTDQVGRGCGSLVYCNEQLSIDALTSFMVENTSSGDEMTILGKFVREHPENAHPLPSASVISSGGSIDLPFGLFDAMSIGQWLFGLDPANTVYSTFNKEPNSHSKDSVQDIAFFLKRRKGKLFGRVKRNSISPIHNLHVHSKIFSRLLLPGALRAYLLAHRLSWRIPMVIQPGHWRQRALGFLLARSQRGCIRSLLLRPVGRVILNFLVASSRVPLSNRQLEAFHSLLPATGGSGNPEVSSDVAVMQVVSASPASTISCSLWRQGYLPLEDAAASVSGPSETKAFLTPLDALGFILSLDLDTVIVLDSESSFLPGDGTVSTSRQALWPDRTKPRWDPHFELPAFPNRSRAVTFTTTPQVIHLSTLREVFSKEGAGRKWAKQVRPDTFARALINTYGQYCLATGKGKILLTRA